MVLYFSGVKNSLRKMAISCMKHLTEIKLIFQGHGIFARTFARTMAF